MFLTTLFWRPSHVSAKSLVCNCGRVGHLRGRHGLRTELYGVAWGQQFGANNFDAAYSVAVDATGNAFVTGEADGSLGGNAFLRKYDTSGNVLWTHQLSDDAGYSVAMDATGNAFVTGATGSNTFLCKYGTSGNAALDAAVLAVPAIPWPWTPLETPLLPDRAPVRSCANVTPRAMCFGRSSLAAIPPAAIPWPWTPLETPLLPEIPSAVWAGQTRVAAMCSWPIRHLGQCALDEAFGTTGTDFGWSTAVGAAGNVFVAGSDLRRSARGPGQRQCVLV